VKWSQTVMGTVVDWNAVYVVVVAMVAMVAGVVGSLHWGDGGGFVVFIRAVVSPQE
jgi:hypothetical protein